MSLDQVVPIVISPYIKKVFATNCYSGSFDDTRLDGLLYWDTTYWKLLEKSIWPVAGYGYLV